jgi:ribose/xylose/arabinose/galactoside ABC-type transport system permease subunit
LREGALVTKLDADTTTETDVLREALPQSAQDEIKDNRTTANKSTSRTHWFNTYREAGLALFVLLMIGIASLLSPAFATIDNMRDLFVNNAILFIGAIGVGIVIISGAIDISIGAVLGLSAVTAGLLDQAGAPPVIIAGGAIITGCLLGVINGTITVLGGVHSIVITLGTMSIFRAGILQLTGGKWLLHLSPQITGFSDSVMGIPILILVGISVACLAHLFLQHTKKGRDLYALGGNAEHAAYLGIMPRQILPIAFGICGLMMGIAGLLQAARYGQVQTNVGIGFELRAIAAAVIGGTHIMGGRGSALGIFFGAMVMGLLANLLVLLHISTYWEGVAVGLVILMAVVIDKIVTRRQA